MASGAGYHIQNTLPQELSEKVVMALYEKNGPYSKFNPANEIISKRTETSKTFENIDGTLTALLTAGPLHYFENGAWKTASNQIVKTQKAGYQFSNTHNQIKTYYGDLNKGVSFYKSNNEHIASYTTGKIKLYNEDKQVQKTITSFTNTSPYLSSAQNNEVLFQLNAGLTFSVEQYLDQIESKYIIEKNIFSDLSTSGFVGFEEYISFDKDVEIAQFIDNANTLKFKNKELVFIDTKGNQILTYKDLFYFPKNKKHLKEEADYIVEKISDKKFKVTMLVPLAWLNNENTTYPIVIDPTLSAVPNSTNSWTGCTGTLPNGTQPSGDNGYLGNNMECGFWDRDNSGNNDIQRDAFSKFNISSIPANICIINSELKLYQDKWLNGNGNDGLKFDIGWANTDPVPDTRAKIYNDIVNMERYLSYDVWGTAPACSGCNGGGDYVEGSNGWKEFNINYPLANNRILSRIGNGFITLAANVTYHIPNNSGNNESNIIYWRGYNQAEKPQLIITYSNDNLTPTGTLATTQPSTCGGNGTITATPTSHTPTLWYASASNDATAQVGTQTIHGNAAYNADGYLKLTSNNSNNQQGTVVLKNPLNYNATAIRFEMDFFAQPDNNNGGDGWSITYAGDIPASPTGTPDGLSNNNGLEIAFKEWIGSSSNCAHAVSVYFNNVQIGSCALHTNDWIGGTWRNVQLSINASNQLTLSIGAKTAFSNLQLPNDYVNIDKTGWQLAVTAKTGGMKENYSLDNITLWAYNQYEYSIDGGNNWQTSNSFTKPAGSYSVLLKTKNNSSCSPSANLGNVTISNPPKPEITTQPANVTICSGGSGSVNIVTPISQPSYQWQFYNGTNWVNTNENSSLSGHQLATLSINNAPLSLNGTSIRCILTNTESGCDSISNTATIQIDEQPTATVSLKDLFLCDKSAVLEASNILPSNSTLNWEKVSGDGTGSPLSNELTVIGLTAGSTTTYQLKLSNGACQDIIAGSSSILIPTLNDNIVSISNECSSCIITDGVTNKIYGNNSGHLIGEIESLSSDAPELLKTQICTKIENTVPTIMTDEFEEQPYLQRSVAITPQNNGKTRVRIYFTQEEYNNLQAACQGTPYEFSTPQELNVTKIKNVFPLPGQFADTAKLIPSTINSIGDDFYAEFEVEDFSTFYIHSNKYGTSPLPVELTSFTGIYNKGKNINELTWATASENNASYFEIQKSLDGQSWKPIGKVTANGFSTSPKFYQFEDANIEIGNNYYRLKTVDLDQTFELSAIINVEVDDNSLKNGFVKLYPNPTQSNLSVWISSNVNQKAQLSITDISGKNILSWEQTISKGVNQLNINAHHLANGAYILHYIDADNNNQNIKFIKN